MVIDVSKFQIDEIIGKDTDVLIIIKGFHQNKIVKKIIERNRDRSVGLTHLSDITKRKYSEGLITTINLNNSSLKKMDLKKTLFRVECKEPFGINFNGDLLAITSGSEIILKNLRQGDTKRIHSKWMSFLHSVEFSQDGNKILVASAGYDSIIEFDLVSNKICWEWNAWDNGFHFSRRTQSYITRNKNTYDYLCSIYNRNSVLLVDDINGCPEEGIPTSQSPTRLNCASYGENNEILATCYHRPELFTISRNNTFRQTNLELVHPHSFKRVKFKGHDGYWVTDSGRGKLILLDKKLEITCIYDFSKITANSKLQLQFGEWIQSVSLVQTEYSFFFIAVDALRKGLHLIDPINMKRRFIQIPSSWTVQTVYYNPQASFYLNK